MLTKKLLPVLIAMALAVIAGHLTGMTAEIFGVTFYSIFSLVGQLFLNALTLVVVPLVASSIISGTARMGQEKSFGKLGGKTFAVFLGTNAIAILIGWALAILIQPGVLQGNITPTVDAKVLEIATKADEGIFAKLAEVLLKLVPSNILAVASQGQMLGLIFFSLLFGFLISKIEKEPGRILLETFRGIFQVMMKMTELVMVFMPIGVFALVAKIVAETGWDSFRSLGYFVAAILLGLSLYMFGALSLLLRFVANVSPMAHLRAMSPALLTAFSTSSSAATLPVSIDCLEQRSGVSNRITSFTLPLGISLNLAGSSMQVILAVFFIAQVYHLPLSMPVQFVIFFMTWILSVGVAGIPSASLISIVIILTAIGLPAEGVSLIMAIERLGDMCRTTVNVYSNSCSAVIIARSEEEKLPIAI